jgi:ketosteroid isomerase-like protein
MPILRSKFWLVRLRPVSNVFVMMSAILALFGCQEQTECPGITADFDQIFAEQYAKPFREGDAETWAQLFATDAMGLHNRREADLGQDAIRAFGQLVASTFRLGRYDVALDETRRFCDWAVSRGSYQSEFIFRETNAPAPWGPQAGKFLIVWTLDEDQNWRVLVDMGNSNQ